MMRMFSPRHVYTATSSRPIAPMPSRDESLLVRIGFVIHNRDGVRVIKNRNRFGHADAVLAVVASGLVRLIPLEAHILSVLYYLCIRRFSNQ